MHSYIDGMMAKALHPSTAKSDCVKFFESIAEWARHLHQNNIEWNDNNVPSIKEFLKKIFKKKYKKVQV